MPFINQNNSRKNNLSRIPIDWEVVDKYLEAGCLGTEIAAYLGCHPETFYDRCLKEKGVGFSEYLATKRSKGDAILRAKQYELAMQGNTTLLIWLGKNRLGQRDKEKDASSTVTLGLIYHAIAQAANDKTTR